MDDLPEFDAESLFGNWPRDDNAESTTYVDDTSSGGGLMTSSKANLTSAHLNQILDAAAKHNDGDACKDDGSGGDEPANLGSSSTSTNNNFTFPMYYPLNQGRNHPLAMTSMASCPPYANAAYTAATTLSSGQGIALEQPGLNLMSQQPQAQQAQQQLALATSFNAATSNNNDISGSSSGGISSGNNVTASKLSYNSPYSTHLRELTANFRNNPNISVHYGMAVNGFHPQVNARVNPVFPLSNNARIGGTNGATQQTLAVGAGNGSSGANNSRQQSRGRGNATSTAAGAASTHTRNSRERNNREQLRAQKITQLISELRENMEKGGWQEEMKSKYQTLSQCKDYVEYLTRYHKEKEAEIARTKKLVEEKVLSEANLSDSVTSDLTAFTTRSTSPGSDSKESSLSSEYREHKLEKKRKKQDDGDDAPKASKKARILSGRKEAEEAQQQQSSTDSSYEDDEEDSPGGRNISFDKACSSVSDMTDSNKSSTTNNHTKSSIGSISSTAAVVRGVGSSQHTPNHHHHRRRSHSPRREAESNSMNATKEEEKALSSETGGDTPQKKKKRGFDYDYREVFLKSSVPQLIATLSGRIVVWNDFFLQATGLNKRDIGRLTIFSIVQSDQLSTLYKMVARALAEQHVAHPMSEPTSASGVSCKENVISTKPQGVRNCEDWQIVTLRCVRFPSSKNEDEKHPLFLTITLMDDANREQRCFHCTLTDTPSDVGQCGTVSPHLLARMFAPAISTANKGY